MIWEKKSDLILVLGPNAKRSMKLALVIFVFTIFTVRKNQKGRIFKLTRLSLGLIIRGWEELGGDSYGQCGRKQAGRKGIKPQRKIWNLLEREANHGIWGGRWMEAICDIQWGCPKQRPDRVSHSGWVTLFLLMRRIVQFKFLERRILVWIWNNIVRFEFLKWVFSGKSFIWF